MYFARRSILALGALGALGALASAKLLKRSFSSYTAVERVPETGGKTTLPIGMNLAGIADWEPGFPFRNLMWGARRWLTRNLDGSGPFDTEMLAKFNLDADGYPLQVPIDVGDGIKPQTVFTLVPNVLRPGKYVLLHDGEGKFEGLGGTRIVSEKPGRVVLQMSHREESLEVINIRESRLGNHLRNIRLVRLEDEFADLVESPFTTEFLDFCRPFHCLRFMDWAVTNNSLEEKWAQRKRASFYTMAGSSGDPDKIFAKQFDETKRILSGGVAIEIMVKLANTLMIDPWFCIPHRADDDYIRNFATLVKEKLDPKLKVYVEYSNELWNWGFLQSGWMLRSPLAGALVEAKGAKAWEDPDKTKGSGHPERIGALLRRAFGIWESVWTGPDRTRLIRVCAVQAGWEDASNRTVKWCAANGGADAVSPAGYVGPNDANYAEWATLGAALTPERVIADLRTNLSAQRAGGSLQQIVQHAHDLGMRYVAYEGGQHLQPKGQADLPYAPALALAQSHPSMYNLYVDLLKLHRDLGCDLFCHLSSVSRQGTRFGSWGAKATYDQPLTTAPKMRALLDCNTPRPR